METLPLADSIPLRNIIELGGLKVPSKLSRRTADRLVRKGLAEWTNITPTPSGRTFHGTLIATAAGIKAAESS